tara:strand:- start:6093 stop:6458 length:366 start_codon:yes stop_codon:yes gene_type:complete
MAGRKKIVDDNYEKILKEFSNKYFDNELQHGNDLFSEDAWPKKEDKDYVKKATFLTNCRKSHLMLLKQMATHISGLNNASETEPNKDGEAEKLLKKAMERMAPKEDTNETVNDGNPVNKDE